MGLTPSPSLRFSCCWKQTWWTKDHRRGKRGTETQEKMHTQTHNFSNIIIIWCCTCTTVDHPHIWYRQIVCNMPAMNRLKVQQRVNDSAAEIAGKHIIRINTFASICSTLVQSVLQTLDGLYSSYKSSGGMSPKYTDTFEALGLQAAGGWNRTMVG